MNDDDAFATKGDLKKLEESLEAKLESKPDRSELMAALEALRQDLSDDLARHTSAITEEIRGWFRVLDVRADLDAHVEDRSVHRTPRRRAAR